MVDNTNSTPDVSLSEFQRLMHEMYFEKDDQRGISGTFMWLMEEMGELASELREFEQSRLASDNDREAQIKKNLSEEFADVLAWLTTIANVAQIDLTNAVVKKYGSGCPGCGNFVCNCSGSEKP